MRDAVTYEAPTSVGDGTDAAAPNPAPAPGPPPGAPPLPPAVAPVPSVPGGPAGRPVSRLRRLTRTPDGKLAGVCAGLGHYFGIDPVLVRIVVVALTLAGGSGLIAYVIAAIIIPKAQPGESMEPAIDGLRSSTTATLAGIIGLALGATLLFGGQPFGGPVDSIVPLLLVAGGIALLLQRRDATTARPSRPSQPPHPTGPSDVAMPVGGGTGAGRFPDSAGVTTTMPLSGADSPEWSSTWFAPDTVVGDPAAQWNAAANSRPSLPDRRFPFTLLTLSVLAILAGGMAGANELGWASPSWTAGFAASLVIIGVVAVVAAFVGRARWLIVLGLLCSVALGVSSVTESWARDGVGERTARPTLAEFGSVHRHGIGHLVVDVRDVDLVEGTRTLTVRLGMGEAEVFVPADVDVELRGHVGVGAIAGPGDVAEGGFDTDAIRRYPAAAGSSPATIVVDVEVGIGAAVVRRG